MNKIVNGKKCTILCKFDNLKMLHINPNIVSSVLAKIDVEYRKMAKITISRGNIHTHLGMTIEYSSPEKSYYLWSNILEGL